MLSHRSLQQPLGDEIRVSAVRGGGVGIVLDRKTEMPGNTVQVPERFQFPGHAVLQSKLLIETRIERCFLSFVFVSMPPFYSILLP